MANKRNTKKQESKEKQVKSEDLNEQKIEDTNTESTEESVDQNTEEPVSCEEEIKNLEAQIAELKDKHLRLFSEFDNFRKRTTKERIELFKTANADLILDLIPVLDDFERAQQSMAESSDAEAIKSGVELVYNKLYKTLEKRGLQCMDSKEKEFDTDFHEAITEIPAPTEELKSKVVDVVEKGYTLNDKVIRYAKVVVGK
ncbi:nucleotide exchange factor GrpE [Lentimicrobium sp. L6]|nr:MULTISPECIES: nucleotide exchange factor GrpE [unclassified Lentimicrobium]NPD46166.1 nucleotide exchange factor GrpE [Lentimicrobium sp. S6]NPD83217.1 nucleotide exchange factor GrpE [Lentimicrobium sp. L6]